MRILYAIQGTGNGHITVAREVLPILKKRAEVDILVSGTQVDVGLPYEIRYRLHGLCFVFGKKGGIDYAETFRKANVRQLFKDIQELPVEQYDLVISDFEPVSAWACLLKGRKCIGFSHQAAVVSKHSPRPTKPDLIGKAVLKHYAPVSHRYGFHFLPYDRNIFTPVIRSEVRALKPEDHGHYTVYLPAYSDKKIIRMLSGFPEIEWRVFSKHSSEVYSQGNVFVQPVNNEDFLASMATARGVLCGGGFQTPSEAIFLKKKLMVIPMKGQYEQQCNGVALQLLGIPVIKNLKRKQFSKIREWVDATQSTVIDFPDETATILDEIIERFAEKPLLKNPSQTTVDSSSSFRDLLLRKIFYQLKG